jgi:hypothetical protein
MRYADDLNLLRLPGGIRLQRTDSRVTDCDLLEVFAHKMGGLDDHAMFLSGCDDCLVDAWERMTFGGALCRREERWGYTTMQSYYANDTLGVAHAWRV